MSFFCLPSEELSDEYQTDYDEEAVESALSDFEAFTPGSEYTEGEETADTAETVCKTNIIYWFQTCWFMAKIDGFLLSLFTGWGNSSQSTTPTEECITKTKAMTSIKAMTGPQLRHFNAIF